MSLGAETEIDFEGCPSNKCPIIGVGCTWPNARKALNRWVLSPDITPKKMAMHITTRGFSRNQKFMSHVHLMEESKLIEARGKEYLLKEMDKLSLIHI